MNKIILLLCCISLTGCTVPPHQKPSNNSVQKSASQYPKDVLKNLALETCKDAIRATLYFPTSFKPDISKTTIKTTNENGVTLKIPFTAKTGIGQATPQVAYCVVDRASQILVLNMVQK